MNFEREESQTINSAEQSLRSRFRGIPGDVLPTSIKKRKFFAKKIVGIIMDDSLSDAERNFMNAKLKPYLEFDYVRDAIHIMAQTHYGFYSVENIGKVYKVTAEISKNAKRRFTAARSMQKSFNNGIKFPLLTMREVTNSCHF
ncbi:MAG: hypothetical protein CMK92_05670 [Pseudomonas sp.]|nr:hypothetical protein [Pseudomonas sp.]|tara:strand:- start:136 stop:564 length:429 start_codon:yes stop_codon:yes gene_type:complete